MVEMYEEILNAADEFDLLVRQFEKKQIQGPLQLVLDAAEDIGKSWSGSCLGYHANVYYRDLKPRPPGAHFSQEWGLRETFSDGTIGDWVEYDADQVKEEIYKLANNPDFGLARGICEEAKKIFEDRKFNVLSILDPLISSDSLLNRIRNEIDELSISSERDFINALKPRGKFISRDAVAVGQGIWTPAHLVVISEIVTMKHAIDTTNTLAKLTRRAGSHLSREQRYQRKGQATGTNVFIGHGRSLVWRELKDFLEGRLELPADEFNRVPVAGITNIERLSEMLDNAAIAFLVLTGEDEQPDGKLHARMNVVHEAGLFQGRLGFPRAIVLLEEGCEEFSNIAGLGQIRFPKGRIGSSFEEIREVLEREGILSTK